MRSGLTITLSAALVLAACGGGDDRLGDELPPVRIVSGSTTSTIPTTVPPRVDPTTTLAAAAPDTTTPPSVLVPATTTPSSTTPPTTTPPSTAAPSNEPSSSTPTTTEPSSAEPSSPPTTTATSAAPTTVAAPVSSGSGNGTGAIGGAATVGGGAGRGGTSPADRVTPPVLLAWVGGPDVVDGDRSLPAAVATRLGQIDGRAVEVRPFTDSDPDPDDLAALVGDATDDGATGIIVAISPTMAAFGGTGECDAVTPRSAAIDCLLTPPTGSQLAERSDELVRLADAIEAAATPVYVYISGVSSDALSTVALEADIATAEAAIGSVDPDVSTIDFGTESITRGVTGTDEGVAFDDALTPSASGIELLADLLTPAIESFFDAQIS